MRGERAFFEDHTLQPAAIVFEQFGGAKVARDQDRVAAQTLAGGGADLAADRPQQAVRQIFQIVHPVGEQRVVDLAHPHPGALLDPLDRRLGSQPAVDRFVDPAAPAFVVGEHAIGFEHLVVLATAAEFGLAGHLVDLLAHLVERQIDPLALGLGVFGDDVLDRDPRLVEHCGTRRKSLDQCQPGQAVLAGGGHRRRQRSVLVDQFGVGDQFGQDHRDSLQRLDLDFFIAPRFGMLYRQYANRPLSPHDRHPGKAVKFFLAGFGAIGKVGVGGGFGQVERLGVLGDRPDQPLADRHPGDVNRLLRQAMGGEQFEHPLAQQIDRTDLAVHRIGDHIDHAIQLALGVRARRHNLV